MPFSYRLAAIFGSFVSAEVIVSVLLFFLWLFGLRIVRDDSGIGLSFFFGGQFFEVDARAIS